MNLIICLETGLREIVAHKFRSFLSMLGIVLGVSSLIAMMAIVAGIEKGTRTYMEKIGGLEFVRVQNQDVSDALFEFWNLSPGRTIMDAKAIKATVPGVTHVSPEMRLGARVATSFGSDRLAVIGVWPGHFVVARHELAVGRFISPLDVDRATHVTVIGDEIAEELWPHLAKEEMLGQVLTINSSPFVVVGIFARYELEQAKRRKEILASGGPKKRAGTSRRRWDPFRGKNRSVLIPLSTMFYEFKSGLFPDDAVESVRIEELSLRVGDLDQFSETLAQIRRILGITHRGVDDFQLETREEQFDNMERSISSIRLSGGLIAAISLVVGGIGIANIMLASISERVREIGIRLAVGAKGRDIFLQILVESVSVAFIGGLLGILAGMGLISLLGILAPSENPPMMTVTSMFFSVAFAVLAGIVSGIYPALRASRLDPIEALRYE
jgi:putative ABC transport system permease protein